MNAEQKAIELIDKFSYFCRECDTKENAKEFALICVDEILEATKKVSINSSGTGVDILYDDFYMKVKSELEKL